MSAAKLDIKVLNAKKRDGSKGTEDSKMVRGVVYGKKQESISISVDQLDLERVYHNLGHSSLFDLKIEGESEPISVLLHEVQHQPNSNEIIHFDLYAVTKGQKLQTEIAIHFEGEPAAQADSEKVVSTITDVVQIEALPKDLPEQITLDISDLTEIGDHKLVSDIKLPEGVEILTDPETVVIKIDEAREEPEPEEETPEEDGEEAADEASDSDDSKEDSESTKEESSDDK